MLVGYHYTQASKLDVILRDGLIPQPVSADKIAAIESVDDAVEWERRGIWVWKQRPRGAAHAGSVVFQIAKSGETRVALLRVEYREKDFLHTKHGSEICIGHRGTTGRWVYHDTAVDKARMLVRPVPPKQLTVAGIYDIVRALEEPHVSSIL